MKKLSRKRLIMAGALAPALSLVIGERGGLPAWGQDRVYSRIDASVTIPDIVGNPFDYTDNDFKFVFEGPDGKTAAVTAFYDGGGTWRVRYTPPRAGRYRLKNVTHNRIAGSVLPLSEKKPEYNIAPGSRTPGFVRRDPKDATRFVFDNGTPYYPIGHNVAWKSANRPDVAEIFAKMGAAGENWSRVWMNHWDGKNLDWPVENSRRQEDLSLAVAKRWDSIVDAAEKHGIYFQMTLQHHGQYSSRVNPNWDENPWNVKNGGFLNKPEEFFTSDEAKKRTKAKYRYIVARWGYSPHIMAWELFNEVQFTDAAERKQYAVIAAWHKEMADFLREQDPDRHLVTTSSDTDIPGLYDAVDFVQPHSYAPDGVSTVSAVKPADWKKPIFYGEIGPSGDLMKDDGTFLRSILWASVMSESGGTAQYWSWDVIDEKNMYGLFTPVARFVKTTRLPYQIGMKPVAVGVETAEQGSLAFGPGGGWGKGDRNVFPISPTGRVEGAGTMPAFLQGQSHPELFTFAEFPVTYKQAGTFSVTVKQSAKAGARLVIKVDGQTAATQEFPAASRDTDTNTTLTAQIPAGKHVVRLENTGQDWVVLSRIALAPFGTTLQALGKANRTTAALWVRNTKSDGPSSGTLTVPGLQAGKYRLLWWDTRAGKPLSEATATVAPGKPLTLKSPSVNKDVAVFVSRQP